MAKKYLLIFLFLASSCSTLKYEKHPEKEFRGAWVATVVNIDWPKSGNDPISKQKEDFLRILDFYDDLNFNVLIVQVRTAGDAFYPSEKAPWSRFLSGKEGTPKSGFEDVLQWMVDKTHERGMQFHAWFNPYRATFNSDTTLLDSVQHDFYRHRDWMLKYGEKYYYNPGKPEVWEHLADVVGEVVRDYDIDGVHFDDYFYPYKISGETFKDSLEFAKHGLPGQSLEDWRRSNVDSLVKNVHRTITSNKPWVQFGISPFGVWKNNSTDPKGSDTQAGQTTYEDLYADPLLWMEKKWIDYIVPQAYWSMEYPVASHRKIAEWWSDQTKHTDLYMGNGPYKIRNNADKAWEKKKELPKQVAMARNNPNIQGNVFFSAKSLMNDHEDVVRLLKRKFYKKSASVPAMTQGKNRNMAKPAIASLKRMGQTVEACISHFDSIPRFVSIHSLKNKDDIAFKNLLKKTYVPENESACCVTLELDRRALKKPLAVTIEDAYGNTSAPTLISFDN